MALSRSTDDRILFGVCAGVAHRVGIAPRWMRLAFVVAALASGVGVAVYVLLALLMLPPGFHAGSVRSRMRFSIRALGDELGTLGEVFRGIWWEWGRSFTHDDATVRWRVRVGAILFLAGLLALLHSFGLFWWVTGWRAAALFLLLIGIGFLGGRGSGIPQAPRQKEAPPKRKPRVV